MKTEITLPVSELKAALPGLSKIVPRSSTLPVLGCLKVSVSTDGGTTTLQAHNLDEIATVRITNQHTVEPAEILVPAAMVSNLIKGCPAEGVIHLTGTGEETRIRYPVAGNLVDRQLTPVPVGEWPAVKQIRGEPIALDVGFKQALKEALDSASTDSSRYVLNGACLDVRGREGHYVIGTDGRHLYSANSFRFNLPEPLIVPSRKFVTWPGFLNDGPWNLRVLAAVRARTGEKDVNEEGPWLQIESDRWTYITRAVDGKYPNWRQVVPNDTASWTRLVLSPEAIQAMQTALPMLPGSELECQTVVLEVGQAALTLRARGENDKEDTRVPIAKVSVTGKPVEVALNRMYLLKALKCGLAELRIQDSLSPLVFTSPSKTMVIMPVRLEGPVAASAVPAATPQPAPASAEPEQTPHNPLPAPPSADREVHFTTESVERKDMSQPTMAAPVRGNLKVPASGNGDENTTTRPLIDKMETIKGSLRQIIGDLNEAVSLLKSVEKENKASSKEIASVRQTLRSLQSVEI